MTEIRTAHCGAEPPKGNTGIAIGRCYRPPAHTGDHAGFAEQIDEVFFWRDQAPPASAFAYLEAERAARAQDQQRLLHYEEQIDKMEAAASELTRMGGEATARVHALELEIAALRMDAAVPGAMKCDGCGLVVFTAAISMDKPDQIGVPIAPPMDEPCPNGCAVVEAETDAGPRMRLLMLRPQTWREADASTTAALMRTHDALEQLLRLSNHYAELLNMHDGGARLVFDHPGDWMRRLAELEDAGKCPACAGSGSTPGMECCSTCGGGGRVPSSKGVPPKARGLLETIQNELENHRACRLSPPFVPGVGSAEAIGFHRALHWIREILLGEAAPGGPPDALAPLTRGQALELANAIAMMGIVAGVTDGRQALDGPRLLLLAEDVRQVLTGLMERRK